MIEGLWIINNAGICLYSFETDEIKTKNVDLFGMLLSAIDSLSKEVGVNKLDVTQMGNLTLYYGHRSNILFVLAVDSSHKEEKVKKVLHEIINQFFARYEEFVWTSIMQKLINLELFTSFNENVQFFTKKRIMRSTESREDLADIFKKLINKIT